VATWIRRPVKRLEMLIGGGKMKFIDALKWCTDNPFKRAFLPSQKVKLHFDTTWGIFFITNENETETSAISINEFDLDDEGWEEFVDKFTFKDLFSDWLDGVLIKGIVGGKEVEVCKNSLHYVAKCGEVSLHHTLSLELAKQPIWWKG